VGLAWALRYLRRYVPGRGTDAEENRDEAMSEHNVYSPVWLEIERQWYVECECGYESWHTFEDAAEAECDAHSNLEDDPQEEPVFPSYIGASSTTNPFLVYDLRANVNASSVIKFSVV
jgi:hypothetical protein